MPLLIGSIIFNFMIGRLVSGGVWSSHRYGALIFGVASNLALLAAFKYADFTIHTIDWLAGLKIPGLSITLPLAISFYTFQQIAFLVDSHRGKAPIRSFPAYCLFITFFPHMIAGPIVHHREMMPQFARLIAGKSRAADEVWRDLAVGFAMFTIGLVKKVYFADQFAIWSDNAFQAADAGVRLSVAEAWLGTACFGLQIYLDFSGYSDMALGLARLFGVALPLNFDSPYKASSIIDFWHRWHMTLSRFLRDYVYYPLGGSRLGRPRQYINIMAVMLLGGLWHGAAWTYVAWGGLHGIYLLINHGYRALTDRGWPRIWPWAAVAMTTLSVFVAWVFFRAHTFAGAAGMLEAFAGLNGVGLPLHWQPSFGPLVQKLQQLGVPINFVAMTAYSGGAQVGWVICGLLAMWFLPNTQTILRVTGPAFDSAGANRTAASRHVAMLLNWRPSAPIGVGFAAAALMATFYILQGKTEEFIYFQF
jgi:D-alanyl-lipoteichoic acid acyltransferase DltB (MBOAT superfamily)